MKTHLVFFYDGVISQKFISDLKDIIKGIIKKHNLNNEYLKKIFEISVEELQNIKDYSKEFVIEKNKHFGIGVYSLEYDEVKEKFIIKFENLINREDEEKLSSYLLNIKNMDKSQKREYIKKLLRKYRGTHHSGIGFLEIVKRADDVEYSFEKGKDGILFDLVVYI